MSKNKSCRNCQSLRMTGVHNKDSAIGFNEDILNEYPYDTEIFCCHPSTPEILWNAESGEDPEIMLDFFHCNHYKKQ